MSRQSSNKSYSRVSIHCICCSNINQRANGLSDTGLKSSKRGETCLYKGTIIIIRRRPYTKPVIVDPYYDRPCWMEHEVERKEFVILSADSSSDDVELFFILLFGYNQMDAKLPLEERRIGA